MNNLEDQAGDQPLTSGHTKHVLTHLRHELRTPLNAMIGYSEMLLEDANDLGLQTLSPDLERVIAYSKQLLALINDVLSASKLEVSSGTLDVSRLENEIRDKLRVPLNEALGCTERLIAEAERVEQPHFVADLHSIQVASRKLLAFIADMTPPATQSARPTMAVQDGLINRRLPAETPTSINPVKRSAEVFGVGSLLVVDDNEMNRDVLSRCLMRQGYAIATAASGREALRALHNRTFDLVLLDIMMPEMNGYELLQRMKADPALRDIPAIFISAVDDASGKVKAFKTGGVDYITKPFQAEEVVARVENQLKIARLQSALERRNQELLRRNEELSRAQQHTNMVFSLLADVLPGTVLDGKYRLEEKIGAGGFGAVYRATHTGLNKPVAVKIFRPTAGNDTPQGLERFHQEGISASRVTHPNAIAVLDSGISAGMAYLVMELLSGHTLADELTQKGVLSPARALEILMPVCEALAEAHELGIVHRDIKPDNIFLHQTKEGEVVKVVDFGIAKMMNPMEGLGDQMMTMAGGIVGTPAYIAPERFSDEPYDGRADIYSLGIVLYKMLTGNVPFHAGDGGAYALAIMHLTKEPVPVRVINPNVPEAIDRLVMQTLIKDPNKRPTARDLAQQARALAGMEVAQKPTRSLGQPLDQPPVVTAAPEQTLIAGSHQQDQD